MSKPEIELREAKWIDDNGFWYIQENGCPGNEPTITSDGDTIILREADESACAYAHNVLACLDQSGALDEYLKTRGREATRG